MKCMYVSSVRMCSMFDQTDRRLTRAILDLTKFYAVKDGKNSSDSRKSIAFLVTQLIQIVLLSKKLPGSSFFFQSKPSF